MSWPSIAAGSCARRPLPTMLVHRLNLRPCLAAAPTRHALIESVEANHQESGVPLHPQCAQFLEMVECVGEPPLHELPVDAARACAQAQAQLIGPGPEVAAVDDIAVPVRDGEIPARRYEPEDSNAILVWFPGGGWVLDGLVTHDAMSPQARQRGRRHGDLRRSSARAGASLPHTTRRLLGRAELGGAAAPAPSRWSSVATARAATSRQSAPCAPVTEAAPRSPCRCSSTR